MLKTSPPSLFEVHKAERRGRILAEARRLIARRGVGALTLRELAQASQVSVPTVYNLIGSKPALLVALLEELFARVAARLEAARAGDLVDRALALCEAGWREMLDEPSYFRGLVHAFLVSEENAPLRRAIDERNVALMAGVLRLGQADGELHPWVDPEALSSLLFAAYVAVMLKWAAGELDDDRLPATVSYGLSSILLGAARGRAARKLERIVRLNQPRAVPVSTAAATRKGARR